MIRRKSLTLRLLTMLAFRERSVIVNRFYSWISRKDYEVQSKTEFVNHAEVIMSLIEPRGTTMTLSRFGGKNDGSYVIPNEYCSPESFLISGGIENNNDFEIELANKGVTGIQIDYSILTPPIKHPNLSFQMKRIGTDDSEHTVSLRTLINNSPSNRRIIMKLDIEGAEFESLNELTPEEMHKISCLVLEFHNLSKLDEEYFCVLLRNLNSKIQNQFSCVFVQANNGCLAYNIAGTLVPDNVEVTYIKRENTHKIGVSDVKKIKKLTVKNRSEYALVNIDHILFRGLMRASEEVK